MLSRKIFFFLFSVLLASGQENLFEITAPQFKPSNFKPLFVDKQYFYFQTTNLEHSGLWKSDGTKKGTNPIIFGGGVKDESLEFMLVDSCFFVKDKYEPLTLFLIKDGSPIELIKNTSHYVKWVSILNRKIIALSGNGSNTQSKNNLIEFNSNYEIDTVISNADKFVLEKDFVLYETEGNSGLKEIYFYNGKIKEVIFRYSKSNRLLNKRAVINDSTIYLYLDFKGKVEIVEYDLEKKEGTQKIQLVSKQESVLLKDYLTSENILVQPDGYIKVFNGIKNKFEHSLSFVHLDKLKSQVSIEKSSELLFKFLIDLKLYFVLSEPQEMNKGGVKLAMGYYDFQSDSIYVSPYISNQKTSSYGIKKYAKTRIAEDSLFLELAGLEYSIHKSLKNAFSLKAIESFSMPIAIDNKEVFYTDNLYAATKTDTVPLLSEDPYYDYELATLKYLQNGNKECYFQEWVKAPFGVNLVVRSIGDSTFLSVFKREKVVLEKIEKVGSKGIIFTLRNSELINSDSMREIYFLADGESEPEMIAQTQIGRKELDIRKNNTSISFRYYLRGARNSENLTYFFESKKIIASKFAENHRTSSRAYCLKKEQPFIDRISGSLYEFIEGNERFIDSNVYISIAYEGGLIYSTKKKDTSLYSYILIDSLGNPRKILESEFQLGKIHNHRFFEFSGVKGNVTKVIDLSTGRYVLDTTYIEINEVFAENGKFFFVGSKKVLIRDSEVSLEYELGKDKKRILVSMVIGDCVLFSVGVFKNGQDYSKLYSINSVSYELEEIKLFDEDFNLGYVSKGKYLWVSSLDKSVNYLLSWNSEKVGIQALLINEDVKLYRMEENYIYLKKESQKELKDISVYSFEKGAVNEGWFTDFSQGVKYGPFYNKLTKFSIEKGVDGVELLKQHFINRTELIGTFDSRNYLNYKQWILLNGEAMVYGFSKQKGWHLIKIGEYEG